MSLVLRLLLVHLLINMKLSCSLGSLDNMLSYYETLHHNSMKHEIKRRSIYSDGLEERRLEYFSHGRHFKLHLKRYDALLSPDFGAYTIDKDGNRFKIPFASSLYHGTVDGEAGPSSVSATLEDDDTWTATIRTSSDVYMIEPSSRYLPQSSAYTMVAYRASDMKMSNLIAGTKFFQTEDQTRNMNKYETGGNFEREDTTKSRSKRSSDSCPGMEHRFCPVKLIADYQFYSKIGRKNYANTHKYLIWLMDKIDEIFKDQNFGDCGRGFGFQIEDIHIHTEEDDDVLHYNSRTDFSPQDFLSQFGNVAHSDFSKVCLAHLFTARSFPGNVLGLAYIAKDSDDKVYGGICSREPSWHNGTKQYLNTGWTSFHNSYNDRILSLQVALVAAHEFGHNWGSHHDLSSSSECAPSNVYPGNYLMHPISVSGIEPNNKIFSNCSIREIRNVLKYKASLCFKDKPTTICGNYRVEPGEECDEGKDDEKWGGVNRTKCCSSTCRRQPGLDCSGKDECSKPSLKEDGHTCMNGGGRCRNGSCVELCSYSNLIKCICKDVNMTCMLCCKRYVNDTCSPYNSTMLPLPDYTSCYTGVCLNGTCEARNISHVIRLWSYMEIVTVDQFVQFMRANIVGTVIILSLLIWIPSSCFVSYIDKKREKEESETLKWHSIHNTLIVLEHDRFHVRASTRDPRKARRS